MKKITIKFNLEYYSYKFNYKKTQECIEINGDFNYILSFDLYTLMNLYFYILNGNDLKKKLEDCRIYYKLSDSNAWKSFSYVDVIMYKFNIKDYENAYHLYIRSLDYLDEKSSAFQFYNIIKKLLENEKEVFL